MNKREIIVFAGPNGSGKSTLTEAVEIILPYSNADEIKKAICCTDQEAAELADRLRYNCIACGDGFTFETVLSTDAKLHLLREAWEQGYCIHGFFVLTTDPEINIFRVFARVHNGGHPVPEEKIRSIYS